MMKSILGRNEKEELTVRYLKHLEMAKDWDSIRNFRWKVIPLMEVIYNWKDKVISRRAAYYICKKLNDETNEWQRTLLVLYRAKKELDDKGK